MRATQERTRIARFLESESSSGALIVGAALIGLFLANSPVAALYESIRTTRIGIAPLHLDLTVAEWAADALLSLFFFVVGIELKHELQHGSLARPSRAIVPIAAAFGGMLLPAVIFVLLNTLVPGGAPQGWGIPMATDIAFALALLAVFGRRLPLSLRAFLLTLAIVDDLGAIIVIALFYSTSFEPLAALGAIGAVAVFWLLQRARVEATPLYAALAVAAWISLHASGVHATVAGVALGFAMRSTRRSGEARTPAERAERAIHPWSAGVATPLFALTAAGVSLGGLDVGSLAASPVFAGVALGLIVGKPIGIYLAARAAARFARSGPPEGATWGDVARIGVVAGVGFTVSLLIAELAYHDTGGELAQAKLGTLCASLVAAALAAILFLRRSRAR